MPASMIPTAVNVAAIVFLILMCRSRGSPAVRRSKARSGTRKVNVRRGSEKIPPELRAPISAVLTLYALKEPKLPKLGILETRIAQLDAPIVPLSGDRLVVEH
jgi:hypothetical protein